MSMQPFPRNPIEKRKQEVRKSSRNAVISVGGGLVGGAALWLLLGSPFFMALGLIVAVVGGFYYYNKVQKIINQKDNY
ncbi:hypothetical protein N24_2196 [Corynebacterium suranareeae]|uniref:Uncharacterized protein n=1 Tax=Corynebacterium suranareeae TaxID=2506452 RepID=A0A169S0C7_9CORY|nr:hypothetical protein [Corynebacterium suranareeae]BAU96458.1 hypothetical protein N24_2196 [Corynebacterium suranareeae]